MTPSRNWQAGLVMMHPHQLSVSGQTVRRSVDEQFPEWRTLPIHAVKSEGTVNAIFRIGDQLAARFPLQPDEPEAVRQQLQSEAEAAGELLGRTRFPTPVPVAQGNPGPGYPLPWAVQTWLPGVPATVDDPGESVAFAHDLAEFIQDVHAIDTRGRVFTGLPDLRRRWHATRELPRVAADVMTHGDLIPGNVLVLRGRLAGVLDVGGLAAADPALDLVSVWHLLETEPRQVLREQLRCDDLEWRRGQAWAEPP